MDMQQWCCAILASGGVTTSRAARAGMSSVFELPAFAVALASTTVLAHRRGMSSVHHSVRPQGREHPQQRRHARVEQPAQHWLDHLHRLSPVRSLTAACLRAHARDRTDRTALSESVPRLLKRSSALPSGKCISVRDYQQSQLTAAHALALGDRVNGYAPRRPCHARLGACW